jgi:hypothetical protein
MIAHPAFAVCAVILNKVKNLAFTYTRPFGKLRACPEYIEGVMHTPRYFFAAMPFLIAFTTPSLPASRMVSSMPFLS